MNIITQQKMNKKCKIIPSVSVLLFLMALAGQQSFAQVNELSWINLYGGKKHEMTMGFVKDSLNYHLPIIFNDSIRFNLNGSDTTLHSEGGIDAVVLTVNQDGQSTNYRHFANKGDLSITSLEIRNGNLILAGSFQDSLKMITNQGEGIFIASTNKALDSYIAEISPDNQILMFSSSPEQANQAYINYLVSDNNRLFACGTALIDSLSEPKIMFFVDSAGQSNYSFPCSSLSMEIKSIGFTSRGSLGFAGGYLNGHVFNQDTLGANEAQNAFFAYGDDGFNDINFYTYLSPQDAVVAAYVANETESWIAISFADTLIMPQGQSFVSEGSMDVLLVQMDSLFTPVNYYHFAGIMYEKADNLFVQDSTVYFLGNVSSPVITVFRNGSMIQEITQENLLGNTVLFAFYPDGGTGLVWSVSNSVIGSIKSVDKFMETETVISGNFHDQMKIDSSFYYSEGGMDVYMMRITDICLNTMKNTVQYINFCEGDSLQLLNYKPDTNGKLMAYENMERPFFISKDVTYWFENIADCGCINTDSIRFVQVKRTELENGLKNRITGQRSIYLNPDNIVLIDYYGNCSTDNNTYSLLLTPNPAGNESYLDFTLTRKCKVIVDVFGTDGVKLMEVVERDYSDGGHRIILPVSSFSSGNYIVKVQLIGDDFAVQKILKLMKL